MLVFDVQPYSEGPHRSRSPLVFSLVRAAETAVVVVEEDCVAEPMPADAPRSDQDASLHVIELLFAWITRSKPVVDALTRT